MKVTCDPRKITVSQTNLGKALGLTTGRVAQLIKEGVVFRDDNDKSGGVFLVKSVQAYTSFKGKSESDNELELDDSNYEEYWIICFKNMHSDYIHEINYHNISLEVWCDGKKVDLNKLESII